MRKLFAVERMSVDGYYASNTVETAGMEWFIHDPEVDEAVHQPIRSDTLLLGSATFALFERAWVPVLSDPGAPPHLRAIARELSEMRKLVVTRKERASDWENTEFVRADPIPWVRSLKAGEGSDLLILGSGSLVRELSAEGLVDEYLLIVSPVAAGGGKPLFGAMERLDLRLVGCRAFASGNALLHYAVAAAR